MEYLIGFWLVGVVITSLYLIGFMVSRKSWTVSDLSGGETIASLIFTCISWPAFLAYAIYKKLR